MAEAIPEMVLRLFQALEAVLLYGPLGIGKTFLAEAIAARTGSKLIVVK